MGINRGRPNSENTQEIAERVAALEAIVRDLQREIAALKNT